MCRATDFNKKFVFNDLVKGTIELPENDIDQVLIKSDGIPPYAFAHVCDDHFMRVTTVTRDDSYISSVPYHLEVWDACGFKAPKFAHLLPLNKKEGETIRKLSKRKDPEAAVAFYHERGIPVEAVKLYFATIMNSNFEG
jgi:glutamyl-tRNA synthetase